MTEIVVPDGNVMAKKNEDLANAHKSDRSARGRFFGFSDLGLTTRRFSTPLDSTWPLRITPKKRFPDPRSGAFNPRTASRARARPPLQEIFLLV
jgi:hypothetical protein